MRILIWALCALGLVVSARMQRKAIDARVGGLDEPSVVQTPRARLFGDTPNSALGLIYYAAMSIGAFFLDVHAVRIAMLCAAVAAAAMSVYLAYSLLFVTRMPCVNCWIGHVVNWLLLACLVVGNEM